MLGKVATNQVNLQNLRFDIAVHLLDSYSTKKLHMALYDGQDALQFNRTNPEQAFVETAVQCRMRKWGNSNPSA